MFPVPSLQITSPPLTSSVYALPETPQFCDPPTAQRLPTMLLNKVEDGGGGGCGRGIVAGGGMTATWLRFSSSSRAWAKLAYMLSPCWRMKSSRTAMLFVSLTAFHARSAASMVGADVGAGGCTLGCAEAASPEK